MDKLSYWSDPYLKLTGWGIYMELRLQSAASRNIKVSPVEQEMEKKLATRRSEYNSSWRHKVQVWTMDGID